MKQYWALLKFLPTINPWIFLMPVAFSDDIIKGAIYSNSSHHNDFLNLLNIQNLFFVYFIGVQIVIPEMLYERSNVTTSQGTEFLLTRAIDRSLYYRARVTLFYIAIFIIPIISFLLAFNKPDLRVTEYSNFLQQECLINVPGSRLIEETTILIPRGYILVTEWHLWIFAIAALIVQVTLLLIYNLKYRQYIGYSLLFIYLGATFLVVFNQFRDPKVAYLELLFFSFASHPLLFWIVAALALLITQIWGERRFTQFEH